MNVFTWTVKDILKASKGTLLTGTDNIVCQNISIDSRKIEKSGLYIAIKGKKHDGHTFIRDVIDRGALCVMAEKKFGDTFDIKKIIQMGVSLVLVENTTKALGDLAAFNRKRSNVKLIAITGSNGKTTTRAITESVISKKFNTLATSGNFNNEIGLPLTLLRLNSGHKCAVVELGMNRPGEISYLSKISSPDIGIITNIGYAHLEGAGGIKGVAKAKKELLYEIDSKGTAILNADDMELLKAGKETGVNTFFYGFSKDSDITAKTLEMKNSSTDFSLVTPIGKIFVSVKIPGLFMVKNALAAASAGYLMGVGLENIKKGIENFIPEVSRMKVIKTESEINIIDDTYNANPDSVKEALKTLKLLKGNNCSFAVLGDMYELGKYAEELHYDVGVFAVKSGVTKLYLTGSHASCVAEGALAENMKREDIIIDCQAGLMGKINHDVKSGFWILVKGSRAMKMEKIVRGIVSG